MLLLTCKCKFTQGTRRDKNTPFNVFLLLSTTLPIKSCSHARCAARCCAALVKRFSETATRSVCVNGP